MADYALMAARVAKGGGKAPAAPPAPQYAGLAARVAASGAPQGLQGTQASGLVVPGQTPVMDRVSEAGNVMAETTGAPAALRVLKAAVDPNDKVMNHKMDMLTAALSAASLAVPALKLGPLAGLKAGAKGIAAGAAGAGAGQAALGPALQALAEKDAFKDHPNLQALIRAVPAVAGGVAGPIGAAKALAVKGGAPALAAAGEAGLAPLERATNQGAFAALKEGTGFSPDVAARIKMIEQRLGTPLSPAQRVAVQKGGVLADGPQADFESAHLKSPEALGMRERQVKGAQRFFDEGLDRAVPGSTKADPSTAGSGVQGAVRERMNAAADKYSAVADKIQADELANAPMPAFQASLAQGLEDFAKKYRVKEGGKLADIGKQEISLLKEAKALAGEVVSLRDAIAAKQRVGEMVDDAFANLQGGGSRADKVKAQLYGVFDQAVKAGAKDAAGADTALAPLINEFTEASAGYHKAFFSEGAKLGRNLAGIGNRAALPLKEPELVVKNLVDGGKSVNLLPRLKEAAARGEVDMDSVKQAAVAYLRDQSMTKEGVLEVGKLSRAWDKFTPEMRQALFEGQDAGVNEALKTMEMVTALDRYNNNPSGTANRLSMLNRVGDNVPMIKAIKAGTSNFIDGGRLKEAFVKPGAVKTVTPLSPGQAHAARLVDLARMTSGALAPQWPGMTPTAGTR